MFEGFFDAGWLGSGQVHRVENMESDAMLW